MKKLIIILIAFALFSCDKQVQKGYLIKNWSAMELTVNTPESSYLIPGKSSLKISTSKPFDQLTYIYDGHFARVDSKCESPVPTILVVAYTHKFSVHINGTDSANTRINGTFKKVKLPYYWGTNKYLTKYEIKVSPTGFTRVHTFVRVNDRKIDEHYHEDGASGTLSGSVKQ